MQPLSCNTFVLVGIWIRKFNGRTHFPFKQAIEIHFTLILVSFLSLELTLAGSAVLSTQAAHSGDSMPLPPKLWDFYPPSIYCLRAPILTLC